MKIKQAALALSTFVALIAIWEMSAKLNLYNPALLPPPSDAALALFRLWREGTLSSDLIASMRRYVSGYFIGCLLGVVMGVITGISKNTSYAINPLFHYLRSIPPVALVPFSLVLFGLSDTGKITLIAWACMFPVWLSTQTGIRQVPKEYLQAAKVFGVNGIRCVTDVQIPYALPQIMIGLRIAIATGVFALAAAEMFAASSGIGFRIVYSHQIFQNDEMVGMVLLLGFIALMADLLLSVLRRVIVRWERV